MEIIFDYQHLSWQEIQYRALQIVVNVTMNFSILGKSQMIQSNHHCWFSLGELVDFPNNGPLNSRLVCSLPELGYYLLR